MLKEITTKIADLTFHIDSLDDQRDEIWHLEFKDFEDLARAIDSYGVEVCEVDDEIHKLQDTIIEYYKKEGLNEDDAETKATEQVEDLQRRIDYHINERRYFEQKRIH